MKLQKVISRKNFVKKLVFCWHLEGQWRKQKDPDPGSGSESGSISQRHGSADPDPPQKCHRSATLVDTDCIRYGTYYSKSEKQCFVSGTKLFKIWSWDPGSEIRDPGSGKNPFRIPDPEVKKAPDPGSGSATLLLRSHKSVELMVIWCGYQCGFWLSNCWGSTTLSGRQFANCLQVL